MQSSSVSNRLCRCSILLNCHRIDTESCEYFLKLSTRVHHYQSSRCQRIREEMSGYAYEDQLKVRTGLPCSDLTGVKKVIRKAASQPNPRVYNVEDR